jgi:hypothetical protein
MISGQMTMRAGRRHFPIEGRCLLVLLAFLLIPARASDLFQQDRSGTPRWWKIALFLKTDGEFKLDEGGPSAVGYFSFAVQWTGWLEKDDHDYVLYRLDCRLCDWEAQETFFLPESTRSLTTNDFPDQPGFNLKYLIRVGDNLNLDFLVDGMAVPQTHPEEVFPLLLPSSEQNSQKKSEINYNDCVIKGSNRVEVPEAEIYSGPVTRAYAWTWKNQQWLLKQQRTVFTSQSHRVKVNLTIIPHQERRR